MAEIAAMPWNGLNAISTFSGCGGSSLGYRMAGFRVLWANEFVPAAREVYALNHPQAILDPRDIREIQPAEILEAIGLQQGELDLMDGSPPCVSFSTSGKRHKDWGKVRDYSGTQQRADDLFFQFTRLLRELQPKTFIAENVSGLVKGVAKGYFVEILQALRGCGYKVEAQLLDAQWLGVPQMRQRLIFVGVRQDLPAKPVFPAPLSYRYNLREAFGGADELPGPAYAFPPNGKTRQLWEWTVRHRKQDFADAYKALFRRESWFNHRRCLFTLPAPTIVQGSHCIYHPSLPRTLSLPELRRVSAFPDDFQFTGTFEQQWERIGRAVPPLMMASVAAIVRDGILLLLKKGEKGAGHD